MKIAFRGAGLGVAFLLLSSCAHLAAVPSDDAITARTAAMTELEMYLMAYNGGDPSAVTLFLSSHFDPAAFGKSSIAERAALITKTRKFTGPLVVRSVEHLSPEKLNALVQSSVTEEWFKIELETAPDVAHAIVRQTMNFTNAPPTAAAPGRIGDAEVAAQLRTFANRLHQHAPFDGEILVASAARPIFAWNAPARDGTAPPKRFSMASVGKMFTIVAIAQLEQDGRLALTDPIGKFVPDYPNRDAAANVTIGHLLTHMSGLAEYMDHPLYQAAKTAAGGRLVSTQNYLPFFASAPLQFRPGEKTSYTNSGYVVLGLVVERLSGRSFPDYVTKRIFEPAGMSETDLDSIRPAGGEVSTARDMVRFGNALLSGQLLNSEQTRRVLSGSQKPGDSNAYGIEALVEGGVPVLGHGGGAPGVGARLDLFPTRGEVAAVLVEGEDAAARRLADKIRRTMVLARRDGTVANGE